ncbi:ATP-binding protein [Brevundimonas diminuta]
MAAGLIYDHLASGRLDWIGVAHRGAGAFDDIVLGLRDAVVGFQVKTSLSPTPFRLETRLLGAEAVWPAAIEALGKLAALDPPRPAALVYACDDHPSINDQLGHGLSSSTADLLRLHEQHKAAWTLEDWRTTPFGGFLNRLQQNAGLEDDAFLNAWRSITFIAAGGGRAPGTSERTPSDTARIEALAALLPKLAADAAARDQWSAEEILSRLHWGDAFKPRHSHRFPVHALHQPNVKALARIADALSKIRRGYLALVGPPGSGKSTLLAEGILGAQAVRTIRYLAFIPDGRTLGRGEAVDFLHDVIADLKLQGLGSNLWSGQTLTELREQFATLLSEAGRRFVETGVRTLIVVDGLDHIPREQSVERSLLTELPPPDAIPDGVVFLLGTQRVDLEDIPLPVRRQACDEARCIPVPPLSREDVVRLAKTAGLPPDIDADLIFDLAKGHPLSTRYVIEGLIAQPDEATRSTWLAAAPTYAGDIDAFYASAWDALRSHAEARKALAYLALADGPVRVATLEALTSRETVDQAWVAARHLLRLDDDDGLALFHNSFRLFLRAHANERLGRTDPVLVRERYLELAEMARTAGADDPQRWMELRYRFRAGAEDDVLQLATPERFRDQFIQGRRPSEIQDDLGLAFRSVANKRRAERILPLLLARHEIDLRAEAMNADVVDAYLNLGDRNAARGLLETEGASFGEDVVYRVIDADLAAGDVDPARASFEDIEPIEQLLGAKPVSDLSDEGSLMEWASRALAFRPPAQFLQMIARLVGSEGVFRAVDVKAIGQRLHFAAMDGELRRRPETDPESLRKALDLPTSAAGVAQLYGALASHEAGRPGEAVERLSAAVERTADLEDHERRTLGWLAVRLGRPDLARRAIDGVPAPSLASSTFRGDDDFGSQVDDVLDYAHLSARLGLAPCPVTTPEAAFLATLQARLEALGRMIGQIEASEPPEDAVDELSNALRFLATAEGDGPHDFDRHRLDRVMDRPVSRIVGAAIQLGPQALKAVLADLDDPPETVWRLRQPDVRRTYGLRVFRYDGDVDAARRRVGYVAGLERRPEAQLAEAARSASALVRLGLEGEARELLRTMHLEGCGLSRPAKKDPQYIAWSELLEQACTADPVNREARVSFMIRFISGLADTEGHDSGGRVLPEVLTQAAQGRTVLAASVADRAQSLAELNWPTLIASIGRGVATRDPRLALATATVVGRLAAPFAAEYDVDPFNGLIALAPAEDVDRVAARILDVVETDTAQQVRLQFLEAAALAARDRGVERGWDRLNRWRAELPRPRSGSSPEDPFFHARTLDDVAHLIVAPGDHPWDASRTFARIAPREGYEAAREFLDRFPSLLSDKRVLKTIGDLALEAGDHAAATRHRDALRALASDRDYYDRGWSGGAKLLAWQLDVRLNGEPARREAFDAFLNDLSHGWMWPSQLLQYAVDILGVISPAPTWSEAWAALEDHLTAFREYALGEPLALPSQEECADSDGADVLADLLHRALGLGPMFLAQQVRLALQDLAEATDGDVVIARLVVRLLDGPGNDSLHGAHFAWVHRDAPAVQAALEARLPALVAHTDYGVRRIGRAFRLYRKLPATPPAGALASAASDVVSADAAPFMHATWPINHPLRLTAAVSGVDAGTLRQRVAGIIAGFDEPPTPAAEKVAACRATSLDVFAPQPKLIVCAAFRAQRILLSELIDSGEIELPDAEEITHHCGVDGVLDHDLHVEPRPVGLCRPEFGEPYRDEHYETWLGEVSEDVGQPALNGLTVVAGWARHRSFAQSGDLAAEQVFGAIPEADDFDQSIGALPPMLAQTRIILGGTEEGSPTVRRLIGTVFWSDAPSIGLCPALAAEMGWRPAPRDLTRFVDVDGATQVRTLTWRDSGCVGRLHGETILREGQLIVASSAAAERLAKRVDPQSRARAWRTVKRGAYPIVRSTASLRR